MGYLFLFLALVFGITKAYSGKRSSYAAKSSLDAITITSVRMVLCVIFGLAVVLIGGGVTAENTSAKVLLIALLCGVTTASFTACWLLTVRTSAYMIVEVFVTFGVVIPLTLSAILYKESIGILQGVGILLLIIAVYCMSTYNKTEKIRLTLKDFLLLFSCSATSGLSDFSQKLYIKEVANQNVPLFNLYTYSFAAIVLVIACIVVRASAKNKAELKSPIATVKPIFIYVVIMAVCLFLNAYFKTRAAGYLDAVLLYPLSQGCAVILAVFMAVFLFKEKINAKGILGVALSLLAMILINL